MECILLCLFVSKVLLLIYINLGNLFIDFEFLLVRGFFDMQVGHNDNSFANHNSTFVRRYNVKI